MLGFTWPLRYASGHDKEDIIELEVVRLVKKFGAGKNARYAEHVSLAGNGFGVEFLRRIVEGAYWERKGI